MPSREIGINQHDRHEYLGRITQAHKDIVQSHAIFLNEVVPELKLVLQNKPPTLGQTQDVLIERLCSWKYHSTIVSAFTHYHQLDEAGKAIEQTNDIIAARLKKGKISITGDNWTQDPSVLHAIATPDIAPMIEADLVRVRQARQLNPVPDLHGAPSPKDIAHMALVNGSLNNADKKTIEKVFLETTDPHMIAYMDFLVSCGMTNRIDGTVLDKHRYTGLLADGTIQFINAIGTRMESFLKDYLVDVFIHSQVAQSPSLFLDNSVLPAAIAYVHADFARGMLPSVYTDLLTYNFIPGLTPLVKQILSNKFTKEFEQEHTALITQTDSKGRNPYERSMHTTQKDRLAYTEKLVNSVADDAPVIHQEHPFVIIMRNYPAIRQGLGQGLHEIPLSDIPGVDSLLVAMDSNGGYMNFFVMGEQTLALQATSLGECYGTIAESDQGSMRFLGYLGRALLSYCQTMQTTLVDTSNRPQQMNPGYQENVSPPVGERVHPQRMVQKTPQKEQQPDRRESNGKNHLLNVPSPVRRDTSVPLPGFGKRKLHTALERLGFTFSTRGKHEVARHQTMKGDRPEDQNVVMDNKDSYSISRRLAFYNQLRRLGFTDEQIRDALK